MEIPGYSCTPEKIKHGEAEDEQAEELTYEGKYNITLPEAKLSCTKDVNCTEFYVITIAMTSYYRKCPRVSYRSSDNKDGVLYVKGIKNCLSIKDKILSYKIRMLNLI